MDTLTAPVTVTLTVHVCDQRRAYPLVAAVGSDDRLAAFITRHQATHAIDVDTDTDLSILLVHFPATYAALFPSCEHGLSADLCGGPMHYAGDAFRD